MKRLLIGAGRLLAISGAVALGVVLGAALVDPPARPASPARLIELEAIDTGKPCVRLSDFTRPDALSELKGTTWGRLVEAKGLNVMDGVFVATDHTQAIISLYTVSGITGCLIETETMAVRELVRRLQSAEKTS